MTFDLAQMIADREAGTPGEWVSQSRPNFGNGYIYTSVLPVTPDPASMDHLLMMGGEYHVCRMTHTPMPEKARKFAVDARRIARVPVFEAEIIRLTARVAELEGAGNHVLHDIDDLAGNSEGVAGLHQNGDVAPWDSLFAGGSFEAWLASVETLRAALSTHTEEPK